MAEAAHYEPGVAHHFDNAEQQFDSGKLGMWLFLATEVLLFGGLFVAYAVYRANHPEIFVYAHQFLDKTWGGINTLVLVTSGWLAAIAVQRQRSARSPRPALTGAMLLGAVFLCVKAIEYAQKFDAGIGIETNTFWTLYFLMTGFHALHVVLGIVILAIVCWKDSLENLETGTAFWHMVDIIWVILYPLIYLLRP